MVFSTIGVAKIPGTINSCPDFRYVPCASPFALRIASESSLDVRKDVCDRKRWATRVTVSPRLATYMALPGGAIVVTSAGGSAALDARGDGFDVRTSSGLWPVWAAAAGSSKANRHEMNPRHRQDRTMIRIELERRKFFSVKTHSRCLSRMLTGR